jgi:hypothetical protein
MRTTLKCILIGVVLLALAGQAFAYPPDNAAVLYYKDFLLLEEPNDSVKNMLKELWRGNIGLNEQIRCYLERNRNVLKEMVTAAQIERCDWGLDILEGLVLGMPHTFKCRQAAYILAADAKALAEKGDYRTALDRCITIHKMGLQIGDDTLILYLVGTAVKDIANKCIVDILSEMPEDLETLVWLQTQMADVSRRPFSIEAAISKETEVALREMRKERIGILIEQLDPNLDENRNVIEQLCQIQHRDEAFFEKSRIYFTTTMVAVQAAFEMPYPRAHEGITRLAEKTAKDTEEKPEAILTSITGPAIAKMSSIRAARETFFNAVEASIGIYIIKAKTGKLPDELLAELPKDMFSGKDFLYEKTAAGFILKCQGKDLDKNIAHQYEFKVAK